ncbi:MAG: epimerase [Pseudomonadota bacterium]
MTKIVLILGATGRFGSNATAAFEQAGWTVRRFDRKRDTLDTAARGVQVIVNGWNPAYSKWNAQVLQMQPAVHTAALANDATVIIPGNVYVFGADTPVPWSETSNHGATNLLGRIRIQLERGYRDAGVRTIILRAGDFLDTTTSGNWFDKVMTTGLAKGTFTYPGNTEIDHAWGYLPDVARAAVLLAEQRDKLARFEDVPFPGYTLSGAQLGRAIASARGHDVRVKQMAWWPLRLLRPVWAEVKHFFEMRYLWNTPHSLDDAKFNRLLPEFEHTPLDVALAKATAHIPRSNASAQLVTA